MHNLKSATQKKILIEILLFIAIFAILGLPYTHWWFQGQDDFNALFLGYKTQNWQELFYFFYNGHTDQGIGPSNAMFMQRTSFFGTCYRPLYCIYHTLLFWIFGMNGYAYLLCAVFFHALNSVLLFFIFSCLIPIFPALLTACTFAFHPQIAYHFATLVNLHFYINMTLIIGILVSFKQYLKSKKKNFYLSACILFILSLFTRESSIVLPLMLLIGVFLIQENKLNFFKRLTNAFFSTAGFWLILTSFLLLRLFLYPLELTSTSPTIFSTVKKKIVGLVSVALSFTYDAFGISWLAWGNKALRGSIVLLLITCLFWLFIKNQKKIWCLYFFICTLLMLWPAYTGYYPPRYFYEVHPFMLMTFILCFNYYPNMRRWIKKMGLVAWSLCVIFYITLACQSFWQREQKMYTLSQATYQLIKNPLIKNRALCFLGHPFDGFGDQSAPLFWIVLNNRQLPVYFDSATALRQKNADGITQNKWRNIISPYLNDNFFKIEKIKNNEFRFTSLDPHKIYFSLSRDRFSLGKKVVHNKSSFTLSIDQKFLDQNPLFITWDYKYKSFALIP